MLFLLVSK